MEWIKMALSAKAWEAAVTLVGGYLAAKNLGNLTRHQFLIYVAIAAVIGIASVDFTLPWLVEQSYLSEQSAKNLKPLALIVLTAVSLKMLDVAYAYVERLKKLKFKLPGWFKK